MLSLYYRLSACRYLWWEVFGDFAPERRRPIPLVVAECPGRRQERFPIAQSRARKRRAFVHNLRKEMK